MKHGIKLWWMGILACLLLTACVSNIPLEVRVNPSNSGQSITMHRGQELIVELQQGVDTSYAWAVTSRSTGVLGNPAKQVIQLENQSAVLERYIFTAMHLGNDQVRIEERRLDHTEETPRREFTLKVTVIK